MGLHAWQAPLCYDSAEAKHLTISLSPETQRLLEEQMKRGHYSSADELLRAALQTFDRLETFDYEDLDPQARAAIEEGEAQTERGEYRQWAEVGEEIRARFIKK